MEESPRPRVAERGVPSPAWRAAPTRLAGVESSAHNSWGSPPRGGGGMLAPRTPEGGRVLADAKAAPWADGWGSFKPPPVSALVLSSPMRGRGLPPRNFGHGQGVLAKCLEVGRRSFTRGVHAAPWEWVSPRVRRLGPPKPTNPCPCEEGAEIEDYWGQLWLIPKAQSEARVCQNRGDLVWIRRDKWEKREFTPADCFPVGAGDVWDREPNPLKFANLFWGESKKTFLQIVKESMVGRNQRGRGPRPRNPEEE